MKKLSDLSTHEIFMLVFTTISISTFYHSSYGYASIDGLEPTDGVMRVMWWIKGGLSAFAVDIGMLAIIIALSKGFKSKLLDYSLIALTIFSTYVQLIFSARFSMDMDTSTKNQNIQPFMQFILDSRIIILPISLPVFSLIYGFSSKNAIIESIAIDSKIVKKKTQHYTSDGSKTSCGISVNKNIVVNNDDVTCVTCLRHMNK
jgi:hypothetical protein